MSVLPGLILLSVLLIVFIGYIAAHKNSRLSSYQVYCNATTAVVCRLTVNYRTTVVSPLSGLHYYLYRTTSIQLTLILLLLDIFNTISAPDRWTSAGTVSLFHAPPSSNTTMRQLCGSERMGLCVA